MTTCSDAVRSALGLVGGSPTSDWSQSAKASLRGLPTASVTRSSVVVVQPGCSSSVMQRRRRPSWCVIDRRHSSWRADGRALARARPRSGRAPLYWGPRCGRLSTGPRPRNRGRLRVLSVGRVPAQRWRSARSRYSIDTGERLRTGSAHILTSLVANSFSSIESQCSFWRMNAGRVGLADDLCVCVCVHLI